MRETPRDRFKMKKVKILPGGGIYFEADCTIQDGGETHTDKKKDTITIIPAESLTAPIQSLTEELLISCHFMGARTLINSFEFHASKVQKEAAESYIDILKTKTTTYQVSVSGEDKNEGVIITAKIQALNSSVIAINSPRIRYGVATFGFEESLKETITLIEDELYEYVFNGKKMHLEAFTGNEQAGKKEDGKKDTELPLKDGEV